MSQSVTQENLFTILQGYEEKIRRLELALSSQPVPTPGGDDKTFTYHQTTAALTWTINHDLNKNPTPIFLDHNNDELIPDTVEFLTLNTVVATFTVETSGFAYLN